MREDQGIRRYFTTTQAARQAHLSPSTLLRAIQDKKLRAFSTPGGHYRIERSSLEAFLRSSGVSVEQEKRKVVVWRLSAPERDELLKGLKDHRDFSLTEGLPSSAADRAARPCVVLLDVSETGQKKKRAAGGGPLSVLQKLCGLS